MSFRDTTDSIVDAMRAHLLAAVNSDLLDELSIVSPAKNAISETYGMPIPLSMVPVLNLPALSIYRGSTAWEQVGRHEFRMTQFHIDYVGPQSPMASLGEIWPLLHRVFEAVAKNLEGWRGAEVVEVKHRESRVTYNFANGEGIANVYPVFSSAWPVLHCPRIPNHTPVVGVPFTLDATISKGPFDVEITTPEETP